MNQIKHIHDLSKLNQQGQSNWNAGKVSLDLQGNHEACRLSWSDFAFFALVKLFSGSLKKIKLLSSIKFLSDIFTMF